MNRCAGLCGKLSGNRFANAASRAKNAAIFEFEVGFGHEQRLGQPAFSNKAGKMLCSGCSPLSLAVTCDSYWRNGQMKDNEMRAISPLLVSLSTAVMLAAPAAAKYPSMPKPLLGIWMTDDAKGRAQCDAYQAALGKGLETAQNHLVGAEVISRKVVHSYAEYGEGNFYQPTSLRSIGKQAWQLKTRVGFDAMPGGEHTGSAEFTLTLRAGKLVWVNLTYDGKPVDRKDEILLSRCADVPAELYGR
jgi:hypothetical protein